MKHLGLPALLLCLALLSEQALAITITKPTDGEVCPVLNPIENAVLITSGRYARASGTPWGVYSWTAEPAGMIVFDNTPDPYYQHTIRIFLIETTTWNKVKLKVTDGGDGTTYSIWLWPVKLSWDLNIVGPTDDRLVHERLLPDDWQTLDTSELDLCSREITFRAYGNTLVNQIPDVRIRMWSNGGKVDFISYDQSPGGIQKMSTTEWRIGGVTVSPTGTTHQLRLFGQYPYLSTSVDDIELDFVVRCPQEMNPFDGISAVMLWTVVEVDLDYNNVSDPNTTATQEEDPGGILCCSETFDDVCERHAEIDVKPHADQQGQGGLDGYKISLTTSQPTKMNMRDPITSAIFTSKDDIDVLDDIIYGFECRGLAPSANLRDVELRIELKNGNLRGGHTCWDKVCLTVLKLDIDVVGPPSVSDANEMSLGGLVVLCDDGNDAPRGEVKIAAVEPAAWSGTLKVRSNMPLLGLYSVETGDTSSQEITVSTGDLAKSFWAEGHVFSEDMRDVEVELWVEGDTSPGDRVAFTVLTAEEPIVLGAGETSANNSKRATYKAWTVANHDALGPQRYQATADLDGPRMGWGTEARSRIWPNGFSYPGVSLWLARDVDFYDCVGNGASVIDSDYYTESQETSSRSVIQDTDPSPDGYIYDFDAPGLPVPVAAENEIHRTRNHFRTWARVDIPGLATLRCSPIRDYYVAFSMKQVDAPTGSNWVVITPPDVTGDRKMDYVAIGLSWDLQ